MNRQEAIVAMRDKGKTCIDREGIEWRWQGSLPCIINDITNEASSCITACRVFMLEDCDEGWEVVEE